MKFHATFKSMLGLTIVVSFLASLSMYAGISGNAPVMVVLGAAMFAVLLAIRIRFKLIMDEKYLTSSGFFYTKSLKWSEITKVVRLADCGYPKNRFYGPYVYEFLTTTDSLKINFKLYPVECMAMVQKSIKK